MVGFAVVPREKSDLSEVVLHNVRPRFQTDVNLEDQMIARECPNLKCTPEVVVSAHLHLHSSSFGCLS